MAVDRSRYNFNGKIRLTKKALIYEVIKKYLENSTDTLEELKNIFSEKSDFNIDMFVDEEAYQYFNFDRKNRYFEDSFKLHDDTNIYLSTQWGGEIFQKLLQKIKQDLQYDIQTYVKQVDNEKKFINYLRRTPSQRGNIPDKNRIKYLVKVLKIEISNKLNEVDNTSNNTSLFNVENINYLKQVKKRLNTDGDLYTWDQENHGQGGCSAALHQYIKFLNEESNPEIIEVLPLETKNIILYGSPGVGKTHNTKKLISLIESGQNEKNIFKEIENNSPNNGIEANQIVNNISDRVKFITFHQSFGYEDFIEGFRPNEDGNIKLVDGVFKLMCKEAQKNLDESKKDISTLENEYNLKESLNHFVEDFVKKEEKTYLTKSVYISNIDNESFYYSSDSGGMINAKIPINDLWLCPLNDIQNLNDIKYLDGISGTSRQRPTYLYELYKLFNKFENKENNQSIEVEKVERKNYYLVIDEINRGNISKIFGELITLIEEDKRDTLEVTLPYSKKPFKIPSNLYIIGTMNSTDKSIALIDIALRRRFTFLKMEPNEKLVPSIARNIFLELNKYISDSHLGKDYQIGHSYFMKIENDDDLEFVLEYKIKPLLEEYFYGDINGYDQVIKIIDDNEIH